MKLAFHFDFVCPWCWIGYRLWREAEQQGAQAALVWQGHQLLPQLPAEGVDYLPFYIQRLGGMAQVLARREQVARMGAQVGLTFNFEAIRRMPNTALAHAVFAAVPAARQGAVFEAFVRAWFQQGRDLGDLATLLELAEVDAPAAGWCDSAPPQGAVPAFSLAGRAPLVGLQVLAALCAYVQRAAA